MAVGGRGMGLGGLLGVPVSRLLQDLRGVERGNRHQGVSVVLLIDWVRLLSLHTHTYTNTHHTHTVNINRLLVNYKQTLWMSFLH